MAVSYKKIKNIVLPDGTSKESDHVFAIQEGQIGTKVVHKTKNPEYLKWLAEGNEPLPADELSKETE